MKLLTALSFLVFVASADSCSFALCILGFFGMVLFYRLDGRCYR